MKKVYIDLKHSTEETILSCKKIYSAEQLTHRDAVRYNRLVSFDVLKHLHSSYYEKVSLETYAITLGSKGRFLCRRSSYIDRQYVKDTSDFFLDGVVTALFYSPIYVIPSWSPQYGIYSKCCNFKFKLY